MAKDISEYTDDELLAALSDEDLMQIAGISQKPKLTGDPTIDMVGVNKELSEVQREVSPLRMIDKGVATFLSPVTQQILGAAKTISGGGSSILENAGILPKSNPNDAFNKLGQMAGYVPVAGAATQMAKAIPGLAGKSLPSLVGQQAVAGAATGAYGTPENRESGAVGGAAVGALLPPATTALGKGYDFLSNIPGALEQIKRNFKNIQNPVQFGKQVRESLFNAKQAVGNTFGNELDELAKANPSRTVDHSDDFGRLNASIADKENNPGLSTQIQSILNRVRNPEVSSMIRNYIDNPAFAKNVTLSESQQIKVAIQNAPDIARKLKQGKFADYGPADLEMLDLLDQIKLSQSNVFPELAKIRKPYAEFMQNYDMVKNSFKPTQLLNKVRNGFGNEEIEQIIGTILPKKTLQDINGFRNAEKIKKVAGSTAKGAAAGAGLAGAGKITYDLMK
jgi:hypothetical protein